jgi:riboflavin kinase/FMN adenylyltransferase
MSTIGDGPRAGTGSSLAVVHGIDGLDAALGRLFVVVGVFDGLHLGHEYLLRELRDHAATLRARPTVITFDHHPDEILTGHAPPLLCDPDERLDRLEAAGVEVIVVQTFDVALRETPFDAFVRRVADRVDLAGFLMTPDSGFGYQRGGTPDTVAALGHELGYEVVVVPPFTLDGATVSSSKIRAAIAAGDLTTAAALLGRPYSVIGTWTPAAVDGTTLSFPMPVALPPAGSYQVELEVDREEGIETSAKVDAGRIAVRLGSGWAAGWAEEQRARVTFRAG